MLTISQLKLIKLVAEAYSNAGILLPIDKIPNLTPELKYRCGTLAKPKSKNGWYLIKYDASTEFITVCYGNFENHSSYKVHINLNDNIQPVQKLSSAKRKILQAQINAKIEADRKRVDLEKKKKAIYYTDKFNKLPYCEEHSYATRKKINNIYWYDLKHDYGFETDLLCIPFFNNQGYMQGYQTIGDDGIKKFCGSVGGCYWKYPKDNPEKNIFNNQNSFFIMGEGFATVLSAKQTLDDYFDSQIFLTYALVAFNCGNLDKIIAATKAQKQSYLLLVDNDSTKPSNAGIEAAKALLNKHPDCEIYPLTFSNGNDANDYILKYGISAFIKLIEQYAKPVINKIFR